MLLWLLIPAREESDWKVLGPFGSTRQSEDDVEDPQAGRAGKGGAGPTGVAG